MTELFIIIICIGVAGIILTIAEFAWNIYKPKYRLKKLRKLRKSRTK